MKTPQQLSREAIDEFKAIYQDEFGRELSDDEVQEIAIRLPEQPIVRGRGTHRARGR